MKKYLVIGNPIEHSLSPELHNYWLKNNNIEAIYEKKRLTEDDLEKLIIQIKEKKINGINVTIPFKKKIIPYVDKLTLEAQNTQSVNTIYLENDKVIGHNTDIGGFKMSVERSNFDLTNKKVFEKLTMKKYLVIGNPIDHSLSPRLHNYWFKENNIDAAYEKKQIKENDIEGIISEMRNGKIDGINVTVPFKKSVIPFLDELDNLAKKTQSVNTIYKDKNKVIGTNTDILGFELSLSSTKFLSLKIKNEVKGKKILILGAGGVTSSIIFALEQMEASTIMLSNRTKEKAENLKKLFPQLELVEWGNIKNFDIIINATSLGLKESDKIPINYDQIGSGKLFYDVIYNPSKTNFLLEAEKRGHQIKNGKMMFVYQAQEAFRLWTIAPNQWVGLVPPVNKKVLQLLEND